VIFDENCKVSIRVGDGGSSMRKRKEVLRAKCDDEVDNKAERKQSKEKGAIVQWHFRAQVLVVKESKPLHR
jgi:hypothetical protein